MMNDKQLTCPTTVKLAQTEHKNTQAMNNTYHNQPIIYDSKKPKKETEFMMTNTTPNLSCLY